MADLVTLRHLGDPVEAQMLVDLLAQEGITATIPGNEHNAMMGGLLSGALNVPLKVAAEDAERAREILDALEDYDDIVHDEDSPPLARDTSGGPDGPYRGGPSEELPERKPVVVIAAGLVMPFVIGAFGASHFYMRRWGLGFGHLAAGWLCLLLSINVSSLFVMGLPLVVVADILGGLAALKRQQSAPKS